MGEVGLGPLARGDVEHRPEQPDRPLLAIERKAAAEFDPTFAAVGAREARVDDERLAVGARRRKSRADAIAVLAMDETPQKFRRRPYLVRLEPAEREQFARQNARFTIEIVIPASEMRGRLR